MFSLNNMNNELIKFLQISGFKTLYIKKRHYTSFLVSKDVDLTDDSIFYEYKVDNDYEKATLRALPKNTYILI